jgi:hypothetical protein
MGVNRDDESRPYSDINAALSPTYNRFFESENRVSSYSLSPLLHYSRENSPGFTEDDDINRNLRLGLEWGLSEKFYLDQQDLFLTGVFQGRLTQDHSKQLRSTDTGTVNTDTNQLYRNLNTTLGAGVGYGRIRNVNPMIRSLRMNERLNALNTGQQMDMNDLRNASEQFTRINGYSQTYDRPEKYFWNDMDSEISTQLMALNPFDLFYLADVLSETIGQRLEGWEVSATVNLIHDVSYSKTENNLISTETSQLFRSTFLSPTISGRWYKNLDLNNQVGVRAQVSYLTNITDNDFSYTSLNIRAEWLHTITDRLLVQPHINYQRMMNDLNFSVLSAGSSFNYFVENNVSIFSTIRFSHTRDELTTTIDETRNRFQFNAGVRYYMRRGLF